MPSTYIGGEQNDTIPMHIACYYFPGYHAEPKMEQFYGPNWTEWELMKRAEPRFPGHRMPITPAWGMEDESKPAAMAKKIEAAASHGIDSFIFDWYWYEDEPFLNRPLDDAFLGQVAEFPNFTFSIMWANHDWTDIFPAKSYSAQKLFFKGAVTWEEWEHLTDFVIENYFTHPQYWKIGGKPYFSIFHLPTLLKGFGGIEGAASALSHFEAKAIRVGLPGIHFCCPFHRVGAQLDLDAMDNIEEILAQLAMSSFTHYALINFYEMPAFPFSEYADYVDDLKGSWSKFADSAEVSYYPSISMGWDSTPRTVQSSAYKQGDYPFMPIARGNTPAQFKRALQLGKNFLIERPESEQILIINAWNEWTEGSYLEPDAEFGMAYLEAIKAVKS